MINYDEPPVITFGDCPPVNGEWISRRQIRFEQVPWTGRIFEALVWAWDVAGDAFPIDVHFGGQTIWKGSTITANVEVGI